MKNIEMIDYVVTAIRQLEVSWNDLKDIVIENELQIDLVEYLVEDDLALGILYIFDEMEFPGDKPIDTVVPLRRILELRGNSKEPEELRYIDRIKREYEFHLSRRHSDAH